jgi:hypothetical protein
MKKLLVICSLLLLSAHAAAAQGGVVAAAAQAKPNFSGVWIPRVEKQGKPDAGSAGWTNVIVEQRDPELKFTLIHPNPDGKTTRKLEFTFYTDGRGETNDGMVYYALIQDDKIPYTSVASTTKWEEKTLVVVHKVVIKMLVKQWTVSVNTEVTMRWELSGDGKTLTRTTRQSNVSASYVDESGAERPLNAGMAGKAGEDFTDYYDLLEARR